MENLKNKTPITILKGIMISTIITLVLLFVFAAVLTYTQLTEDAIPAVIIIITAISLLIGSSIANRKIKKNGMINGAIIGGTYLLLIYIVSSLVSGRFSLGIKGIIMILVGVLFGILGGIVGVNTKK